MPTGSHPKGVHAERMLAGICLQFSRTADRFPASFFSGLQGKGETDKKSAPDVKSAKSGLEKNDAKRDSVKSEYSRGGASSMRVRIFGDEDVCCVPWRRKKFPPLTVES